MIDKTLLSDIAALKPGELDDAQMNQYEKLLVSFVESFPLNEQKIKAALEANDKEQLAAQLETLSAALEKIKADTLASEGREFIIVLKKFDYEYEKVESFVSIFLRSIVMLSIDIQMAKYLDEKTQATYLRKKKEDMAARNNIEKTVLAVDDAAISLTMLKQSLQGERYKLICVNSGESALQYLKNNKPDLFLLDIEMPKMNGYELAEKIRGSGHEAPIIFLTGNSAKEYVLKAIKMGASDFIVKPIYKENLTEKIYRHLYSQNE
jgi:CheY-like chemotaxis protein